MNFFLGAAICWIRPCRQGKLTYSTAKLASKVMIQEGRSKKPILCPSLIISPSSHEIQHYSVFVTLIPPAKMISFLE